MSGLPTSGRKAKTLIIEDDCDAAPLDEANPFSFKEFVKSKSHSNCDEEFSKDTKQSASLIPTPDSNLHLSSEYQETFFKDPTIADDLLDEDEDEDGDWSGSYHPSVIEQTHDVDTSQGSFCEESYRYSDVSCGDPYTTWLPARVVSPSAEADPNNDTVNYSMEELHFRTLQINYEALQQENNHLKRRVREVEELNESQAEKVKDLQTKLEKKIMEEQKEAQDLESMVQQVEANLQMMTKRASKAENHVTKLKQEVALLQIQLNTYKAENKALRRGETAGMNAVKQNANLALENLHKVVSGAQVSIKQLVSGAEALNIVAQLLKSIDKIAEVHDDVP
ncbi:PREDICTED: serologically defined colon cancer antigen 3 [Nanorana parkeri]|uniref:serologically defined colon cancer antigen 3 n=1 Tax=Nanorana parkeri TaxID=125878 RepID=UPI0008547B31|nr:PREDICTED: serologically defined colon cancer antigen 3 [Nanorana parkeri]